jgi:hypothetical protein
MAARFGNTTVDARATGTENESKPGLSWSSGWTMRVCKLRVLDGLLESVMSVLLVRGYKKKAPSNEADDAVLHRTASSRFTRR